MAQQLVAPAPFMFNDRWYWLCICVVLLIRGISLSLTKTVFFLTTAGWWFPYIGDNHPNWLTFFRGVETTNQTGYVNDLNFRGEDGSLDCGHLCCAALDVIDMLDHCTLIHDSIHLYNVIRILWTFIYIYIYIYMLYIYIYIYIALSELVQMTPDVQRHWEWECKPKATLRRECFLDWNPYCEDIGEARWYGDFHGLCIPLDGDEMMTWGLSQRICFGWNTCPQGSVQRYAKNLRIRAVLVCSIELHPTPRASQTISS